MGAARGLRDDGATASLGLDFLNCVLLMLWTVKEIIVSSLKGAERASAAESSEPSSLVCSRAC